ncbi:MAG TPA: diphthine--ammonia ligase [Vicinamibacterales bacterium]|nr:diphthine--ammonia ligase [Vicinamibacterales bacterium]
MTKPKAAIPKAAISWSGGKDCCLAMLRAWNSFHVVAMVTMFNEDGGRSRSHGLRPAILAAHAARLELEEFSARCSWDTYTDEYIATLARLPERGITHVVFGDIMGDGHREWNERVCRAHGLTAIMPLWAQPTDQLVREFIALGGEARLVTVREPLLDRSWLGLTLTEETVRRLESIGVDPCGEFGEYHTIVTNCPRFSSPMAVVTGESVRRGDCWALDMIAD